MVHRIAITILLVMAAFWLYVGFEIAKFFGETC